MPLQSSAEILNTERTLKLMFVKVVLPFRRKNMKSTNANSKTTNIKEDDLKLDARSIRLERFIWQALDTEARLCGRSGLQQLKQILLYYFDLGAVEIEAHKILSTKSALVGQDSKNKKTG